MKITQDILSLDYESDKREYDKESFFEKYGYEKFDSNSREQMFLMLQELAESLKLEDEYSIKRLEITLKYELPFFAVNRKLVRDWALKNFIY